MKPKKQEETRWFFMKIAIDFDGTIVEHEYPKIGEPKLFAFDTLKLLQEAGHQLILWTFRHGKELEEAINFCKENGIEFYAVNSNYPNEKIDGTFSRKLNADIFIDDRNLGGFPGWNVVWELLKPGSIHNPLDEEQVWGNWIQEKNLKRKKKFLGLF